MSELYHVDPSQLAVAECMRNVCSMIHVRAVGGSLPSLTDDNITRQINAIMSVNLSDVLKELYSLNKRYVFSIALPNKLVTVILSHIEPKTTDKKDKLINMINKANAGKTNVETIVVLTGVSKVIDIDHDIAEVYTIATFRYNLMRVHGQPYFIMLTPEQKDNYMKANIGVRERDIPVMMHTDPVAIYFKAKRGDLFEIVEHGINLKSVRHRIVF